MEFDTARKPILPGSPTDQEKYMYLKRGNRSLLFFSAISFIGIFISLFDFLGNHTSLWPLYLYLGLTTIYFIDSLIVNLFSKDFDIKKHKELVSKWGNNLDRRVDIFLPTAGEDIDILQNTWNGILELKKNFKGSLQVYCLDDSARSEVKTLSEIYGFNYIVRPKRGWFKKSGNLRYGYKVSNGEFIAIFDADFRPRSDFLNELLPYLLEYKDIGLVQSPQYFDVNKNQNWLQRGAGEVQELFYRMCQVSRQSHNASICVGSNALYRRAALAETGGTALIQHSEDVHTGFNMRIKGWTLQYIPIVLAKGLCPDDMVSFFKQQYRWCMGSMTLLSSNKFWHTKISLKARLSYFSGFLYYIHTAISSIIAPVIPLVVLIYFPEKVYWGAYLYILPSIIII
ncbi:MAG TPA: glycosyltransferase family 2 protein, partial [Patescibacteria group bacterium]|nr:glycosyltransferase family 2 protein [Patescibacteria group bacterium]